MDKDMATYIKQLREVTKFYRLLNTSKIYQHFWKWPEGVWQPSWTLKRWNIDASFFKQIIGESKLGT